MKKSDGIEIEKICKYCEKAATLFDGEKVLCSKKGIVSCDNHCRKFKYDPLKRIPPRHLLIDSLADSEFGTEIESKPSAAENTVIPGEFDFSNPESADNTEKPDDGNVNHDKPSEQENPEKSDIPDNADAPDKPENADTASAAESTEK